MVCQGHEEPQEQRLKERSKSYFQTRNKIKLHDSKTKTQELKTKEENEVCKINVKKIFIVLTYANMNIKRT